MQVAAKESFANSGIASDILRTPPVGAACDIKSRSIASPITATTATIEMEIRGKMAAS